ncbi:MAG: hypothetical protein ACKO38_18130 [Planctomycetota bacterium]
MALWASCSSPSILVDIAETQVASRGVRIYLARKEGGIERKRRLAVTGDAIE